MHTNNALHGDNYSALLCAPIIARHRGHWLRPSMNREAQKREHELKTFLEFADRAGLDIDRNLVRGGDALLNQPDILYLHGRNETAGFELSRLTDPSLARMLNKRPPIDGQYARLGGHSTESLIQKLRKSYSLPRVELLLYRENIGTPDSTLIPKVKVECLRRNSYTRIWFMSKKTLKVLRDRS